MSLRSDVVPEAVCSRGPALTRSTGVRTAERSTDIHVTEVVMFLGSYITKEEMLDVVSSVYMLVGRHATSITEDVTTKQHVDRIFQVRETQSQNELVMFFFAFLIGRY